MSVAVLSVLHPAMASDKTDNNQYVQTNFVANTSEYKPTLSVTPDMINAWGISIRPSGAGGHFWVTAKDKSFEYVGDVQNSADKSLRVLHQDDLKVIDLPVGGDDKFATGTVFSNSLTDFVITQKIKNADDVTAPAKFLFSSDGGIISAWTERKLPDGTFERPESAMSVIDESEQGVQFFGLAINNEYNRLYAADFGQSPSVRVYDGAFKPMNITFDMPFDENKNGRVDAGEYAPFNVQTLNTPTGENHIFVAYAKTMLCPADEIKAKNCKQGDIFAGEEDTTKNGYGRIAEFTQDGKLISVWNDKSELSAPWGMAYAPDNFGALSGALLVSNFGTGTISAFDAKTKTYIEVMRDASEKPIKIDKIWGILFGNGDSLGDKNALYFAAGPKDETDGVFGVLRHK